MIIKMSLIVNKILRFISCTKILRKKYFELASLKNGILILLILIILIRFPVKNCFGSKIHPLWHIKETQLDNIAMLKVRTILRFLVIGNNIFSFTF